MAEMKFDFKLSSSSGTEEKMKKRMLSFLLCLVMVLGLQALVGKLERRLRKSDH